MSRARRPVSAQAVAILTRLLGGIARRVLDPELHGKTPIATTGRVLEITREREYERLRRGDT